MTQSGYYIKINLDKLQSETTSYTSRLMNTKELQETQDSILYDDYVKLYVDGIAIVFISARAIMSIEIWFHDDSADDSKSNKESFSSETPSGSSSTSTSGGGF